MIVCLVGVCKKYIVSVRLEVILYKLLVGVVVCYVRLIDIVFNS